MSEPTRNARNAEKAARSADRKSNAGSTPDPWVACTQLEYGGDRSLAWSVREQVLDGAPADRARLEERLLEALRQPGITEAGRAFVCQMLALVAGPKSVPVLAPLLKDPRTTEAARYALHPVPGPEAAAALRDALGSLSGPAKAGLIGSIAQRGDSTARAVLAGIRANPAEAAVVRDAAARALDHLQP